jgi:transcriptional regulator with XRE-family HTH domain
MRDKKFAKRLAQTMEKSGFAQESLAKAAGVSQSTVSRWLKGSSPTLALGIRLSTILNVAHEWLIGGLEAPPEIQFTGDMRRRLILARHREGKEISDIAKLTGLPDQTFQAIETGAQIPHRKTLADLISVLNVEEKWILEGTGRMFKEESGFVLIGPEEWQLHLDQAKAARAQADFLLYRAERIEWELGESEKQVKAAGEYYPRLMRTVRKRHRWEGGKP